MSCSRHSPWIQVAAEESLQLYDKGRFDHLISTLPNPAHQQPTFLAFHGKECKSQALQQLFQIHNARGSAPYYRNHLFVVQDTVTHRNPILIAETEPQLPTFRPLKGSRCYHTSVHGFERNGVSDQSLWSFLHSRLFFLFADVVCVFADDIGGLDGAARQLQAWSMHGSPSNAPRKLRPRVIVVTTELNDSATHEILEIDDFRYRLLEQGGPDLQDCFSEVTVVKASRDAPNAFETLQASIDRHTRQMRQLRINASYLFSASHLSFLSQKAAAQAAKHSRHRFDFVLESRAGKNLDEGFVEHVARFLNLSRAQNALSDAVVTMLASVILLDAYPPGMHRTLAESPWPCLISNDA